jgi:molecular chaperone DnaK
MALQLGLRRTSSLISNKSISKPFFNNAADVAGRRFKSSDAGDVIGIDLGTTNSCVAVMVGDNDDILQ